MDNEQTGKKPKVASKSFMAFGPTLHYSHENVVKCWLLAIVAFSLSCLFWSKILTGSFWPLSLHNLTYSNFWSLGQSIITGASRGVSIFEYPWQILVLGPPATTLICYFVDDVTKLCCLGEHLVNVGMLNSHQTPISKGCIRGHLAGLQAELIDIVLLSV